MDIPVSGDKNYSPGKHKLENQIKTKKQVIEL